MGRAARWLRRLLGGKERVGVGGGGGGSERKPEKKRWSFGKSGCERGGGVVSVGGKTAEEAAWLSSATTYAEGEKEQNRRAIKVAAATAAAADAAIAAAQAAVVVVRLTSQGRGAMLGVQERLAAVKIQTVFRSYLARKALRALKALVKLQALVRGYLVRKQAATTFQCMQSLIRAQATIRAQRSRRILACDTRLPPRSSMERIRRPSSIDKGTNYSYNFDHSPKTVEIDTYRPNWQSSCRISPDIADDLPTFTVPSPLNCRLRPPRLAIPELHDSYYDTPHKCRGLPNTTHSTPRYNAAPPTPPTPARNEPGYMAKTRSFEAKTRSQSAPKQRPESPRKKAEMVVESRASLSGVERCSLSRGVDQSFGLGREPCFQRKW